MALYAADGSIRVTVVDGTARTGLYAADGSWNVVESLGTTPVGAYHPCGALWVTVVTSASTAGIYAPDGSLYIQLTPFAYGAGLHATDVLGTLSFSLTALTLAWSTAASDNTPAFSVTGDSLDLAPVGAKLELWISTDVGFTPPPEEILLDAVAGNPATMTVIDALTDGAKWAKVRMVSSADVALTDWSNVVTETIVTVTPRQFSADGTYIISENTRQYAGNGNYIVEIAA